MKQKSNSVSRWILFKSALVALLLGISFISHSQVISTVAGTGTNLTAGGYSGDGGPATAADLAKPYGVAVDASGNIYIADNANNRVRMVNTSGIINTIAGTTTGGYSGDGGAATAAKLSLPYDVAVDASGNVYIADGSNDLIRKVNTSGIITSIAGTHNVDGYSGDGGQATAAEINDPLGVAVDASGNVYIADMLNNLVRKINTSGIISTFAGLVSGGSVAGNEGFYGDGGQATAAELGTPSRIAFDASGNVYISDTHNQRIRVVNSSGVINTFVGTGTTAYNEPAQATAANLDNPKGIYFDASGNLYIASETNSYILKVNTSNLVTKYVGTGSGGYNGDNILATSAQVDFPMGLTVDASGNLFIADYDGARIRKVTAPLSMSVSATNITCNGANNGVASATPAGGGTPYTYSWSPGGKTTSTISSLSVGTYTIHITDHVSETTSAIVTISQPTALSASASATTDVSCNGGDNGSASVIPSGGTSPYTYSWSGGGGTGFTASGLSAATYTVTVTDAHTCTATASVNITQPIALSLTASETANVQCNGGNTGSATASPSNGTSPYTYSWSGSGGNSSADNALAAGTYSVTVTDNCGVSATASVTITQPIPLSTTASVISNTCNGTNDGNASANSSGGTSPYTYSWSNGITSNPTGALLSGGIYTVTVTDNCGNSATASVTIKQSTAIIPTAVTAANVSCYGGSSGQAKVSVSGGTAPYAYSWSPSTSSTYIAPSLSAGTYTVTVVDNNGCNASSSTTITQPTLLKDSVSTITYPQCGGETASATIGVSGGTSPYRYTWSPNVSSTSTATGLIVRSYVVQVKDNNGCYNNLSFSITQPPIPVMRDSIVKSATVNVLCSGGSNGSATVGVKYGTTPYTYSWSTGGGTNATINGLSAGTYSVTVNDAGGCAVTASVSIGQPVALSSVTAFVAGNVNCNGGSNGQAKVSVSGGSIPYTYSWSPNTSSTYIASGLSAGTYTVTVMDNCGASINSSAVITQPVALRDSAIISYPLCSGGTGSATIGVTGGTTPYNYTWSPNISSTATATGLTIRGYVVQVKDKNGCYNNNLDFSISQPATLRDSIVKSATVNISCNGASAGSATAGVKYGTMPYTYSWSPAGGNSATASGLSGGTYTVTVNDGGGCTATASVSITQPAALSPTAFIGTSISCNGGSNGVAKVSVSGGSSPYTYSWLSPASGSTYIASGLSAGTYTVTVSDNCGTSASSSVTVTEPAILSDSVITSSVVSPPCSGGGTGSAAIGVTGGTSPYRYTWSPNVSTTATGTGLTVRGYVVQVKDAKGCYNDITFNVTCSSAPATVTYNKENSASCCPSSDNINLYPNPNTGQFTLSGLQQGMILEMYDYTGKLISSMTTTNESMQLNILNQANGIYLIRILDKDRNLVSEKKVVKTQ